MHSCKQLEQFVQKKAAEWGIARLAIAEDWTLGFKKVKSPHAMAG